MTIIIQAVEARGRSVGRNFPATEFDDKKSPDLAFSNVDRYDAHTQSHDPLGLLTRATERVGQGGTMTLGPMDFRKAVGHRGPMSSRGVNRNETEKSACEA